MGKEKLGKTGFEFSDNLAWGRGRAAAAWQAFDCVLAALNYFMGTRGAGCDDKLGESLPAFA